MFALAVPAFGVAGLVIAGLVHPRAPHLGREAAFLRRAAAQVTDQGKVQRVADAYTSTLQWPLEVRDGVVFGPNAPTAGPPPYAVFELTPTTVFGLPGIAGTEGGEGVAGSFSPTRWRF